MRASHSVVVAVAAAATFMCGVAAAAPDFASVKVQRQTPPKAAPGFTLPDVDGATHALSDMRGKVVMLVFWATW